MMPKILATFDPKTMPFRMRCTHEGCMYHARPSYQMDQRVAEIIANDHASAHAHETVVEDMREDSPNG